MKHIYLAAALCAIAGDAEAWDCFAGTKDHPAQIDCATGKLAATGGPAMSAADVEKAHETLGDLKEWQHALVLIKKSTAPSVLVSIENIEDPTSNLCMGWSAPGCVHPGLTIKMSHDQLIADVQAKIDADLAALRAMGVEEK